MCMSMLPTRMSLCHMHEVPKEGRMGAVSFGTRVIDSCGCHVGAGNET